MFRKDSITRQLVIFSLPLMFSGIVQQMYSWADALIIGNHAGEAALAAIGTCSSPHFIAVALLNGIASGTGILSAQFFGAGDREKQKNLLSTFTVFTLLLSLLIAAVCLLGAEMILSLINVPDQILPDAAVYLRILYAGVPFLAVYNIFAAVIRGHGNSRAPFIAIALSGALNVLLDMILIMRLNMGVFGAGIATFSAQAAVACWIIWYGFYKYPDLRFSMHDTLMNRAVLREGLSLSAPITLQSITGMAGSLILQGFLNSFGTATIAAITTSYRIDTILLLPMSNLAVGISTITAQKLGAGEYEKIREVQKSGFRIALLAEGISIVLILLFAGRLLALFGISRESVEIGLRFFSTIILFYPVNGIYLAAQGSLQGQKDVRFTSVLAICGLALRILLSYLLVSFFHDRTIALAEGLSWLMMMFIALLRMYRITPRAAYENEKK